ncbi:MAG TPA: hypothetical protein VM578_12725 [Candidatus Saccharimonadales bacterium]|nr:hypothetical protein [Candidatus Saccharimonadales bacterium]
MSYQEKSTYVNLVILVASVCGYFGYATRVGSPIRLGGALLMMITLQIVGNTILSATSRRRLIDERDWIIKARGRQVGYIVLLIFIWSSFGYLQAHTMVSSLVVSNLLIVALIVAELSELVAQLISYRASV